MDQPKKGKPHASATKANDRQVGGDHYMTEDGIQHWDLFGPDYLIGYATKYMRWRKKGGIEDLEKAIHVVEKLKEIVTEANLPEYDRSCVLRWQNAVGLDFVERMIVDRIMFMRGRSDLDLAIDGIRYLIEQSKNIVDPSVNGSGINYLTLDQYPPETLRFEMNRLKRANDASRGWGAAVGARLESIKEIESELARRERRRQRRKAEQLATMYGDGGSQHASLFPWCMSKDQWQATFAGRTPLVDPFYRGRGVDQKVLEAAVASETLPRELAACYDLHRHHANGATVWVIKIENVPADLRDSYPHLRRELNLKEFEGAPDWHRLLYRWEESDAKFHLTVDAWTRDE